MTELKFRGKQSLKDFDMVAKSVSRPILPELKKREIAVSGMHGTLDFGGNTYQNRIISVMLHFVGKSENQLRLNARNIAAWLSSSTYEKLTFDDEPDKYYLARVYGALDLNQLVTMGIITVQFECLPFALYQVSTGEDVLLDSDLPLDSDILLNPVDAFTVYVTGNTNFNIGYWGTQELGLGSPEGSKFDIVITGSFTTLSITLNGRTLTYTAPINNKTIVINNVEATVKDGAINVLNNVTGDTGLFLNLENGINTATITGTGLNCSVLFDFIPQYL